MNKKEDWVIGKSYKFIGGDSDYAAGEFIVGKSYVLMGSIDFYEGTIMRPDAVFSSENSPLGNVKELDCFEVGE